MSITLCLPAILSTERACCDHPHHTLFIVLALAHANKDDEMLKARMSRKASGRLNRSASETSQTCDQVSGAFRNVAVQCRPEYCRDVSV